MLANIQFYSLRIFGKLSVVSWPMFSLFNMFKMLMHFRTRINELRNLQYLPRLSEARETMIEDRTKAHADHVGHGHERITTAAVGKHLIKR